MGNKNKKNSNYVTDKTIRAKEEKERAQKRKKQRKIIIPIVIGVLSVALIIALIFVIKNFAFSGGNDEYEPKVTHHADIQLEGYGTLHVELYGEDAPKTVENFVKLAKEGFYNGLTFNQLMKNDNNEEVVLIQAGKNTDTLDPIVDEFSENRISHTEGILSAPSSGFGTNPSKFFIMTSSDYTDKFDGYYAAFGKVTSRLDILEEICENCKDNTTPYNSDSHLFDIHPKQRIRITSITIHASH